MEYSITIDVIEKAPVPVADETAEMLQAVHDALAPLPGDRAANQTFPDADSVKSFLKEAKAWADANGKRFTRVGDIKGQPLRVSFRVVTRRVGETVEADPTADNAEGKTPELSGVPKGK